MVDLRARRRSVKLEDWIHLLQLTIQKSDSVSIFLDGLDECDNIERRQVLKALSGISDNLSTRTFISSRDSVSIDLQPKFPRFEHDSMTENVTPDIREYLDAALEQRIHDKGLVLGDDSLLVIIKETLGSLLNSPAGHGPLTNRLYDGLRLHHTFRFALDLRFVVGLRIAVELLLALDLRLAVGGLECKRLIWGTPPQTCRAILSVILDVHVHGHFSHS